MSLSLSPKEQELLNLLQRIVGQNASEMQRATQEVSRAESTPRYGVTLLELLLKIVRQGNMGNQAHGKTERALALAGAINFKNYIRRLWPLYEGGVPEEDRTVIKDNLVQLMMLVPPLVQAQLSESLKEIALCDFPDDWPNLLPELKRNLKTHPEQVREIKSQISWYSLTIHILSSYARSLISHSLIFPHIPSSHSFFTFLHIPSHYFFFISSY